MEHTLEHQILTIYLEKNIDSTNANDVEHAIESIVKKNDFKQLIFDFEKVDYISSAGLRIMLKFKKGYSNLRIINTNITVYDIFDMTGFTKIMDISKSYQKVSVDGCEVIGQGAKGTVYRVDNDTIIKVYVDSVNFEDMLRERELAKKVFILGVPTAISFDIVQVNNLYATKFELINTDSVAKLLAKKPENIDEYVGIYADLLKHIHSIIVDEKTPEIKQLKPNILSWVEFDKDHLPPQTYKKVHKLVSKLPEVNNLLHCDYHAQNVMIEGAEPILIDMDTVSKGHKVFEFGFMYNSYMGFSAINHAVVEKFLGISQELSDTFFKKTIARYIGSDDEKKVQDVLDKAALIGCIRMLRRVIRKGGSSPEYKQAEYTFYRDKIIELADKLNTLDF